MTITEKTEIREALEDLHTRLQAVLRMPLDVTTRSYMESTRLWIRLSLELKD
jgi:hypothetical protein